MMAKIWRSPEAYNPYYLDHPNRLDIEYYVCPLPTRQASITEVPITEQLSCIFDTYMKRAGYPNKLPASTVFNGSRISYVYSFTMKTLNKERFQYLWHEGYSELRKMCYDIGFMCIIKNAKTIRNGDKKI